MDAHNLGTRARRREQLENNVHGQLHVLVVQSDMFAALTHFFHLSNLSSRAIRDRPIRSSVDIFDEVHISVIGAQLDVL